MEELRLDLNKACTSLDVEQDVRELAAKMLDRCFTPASETLQTAQIDEVKRLKFACLLYLSKKVRSTDPASEQPTWGLPEILKYFKLSIPDFLQELPVLIKEAVPTLSMMFGEDIERKLSVREIQTAFVHILVLGKKARDIFGRFLNLPTEINDEVVPRLRMLWTLFIVAKAELLGPLPDLVSSFNLLVCVSNVMLTHLPKALCKLDYSDKTKFPIRTDSGAPDTLASIAMISKTNLAEINPLASNLYAFMKDVLKEVVETDPDFAFPDGRVEATRPGFPGLMEDSGLEKALEHLDQRYQQTFRKIGEIDERGFVQRKEAEAAASKLATPPSMTKCQVRTPIRSNSLQGLPMGTPMRLMPSPLRPSGYMLKTPSPTRMSSSSFFATPGAVPRTPLTESMHLTAWLRETLANCSPEPSESLKAYFQAGDEDITSAIIERVETLSSSIFPAIQGPSGVGCMQTSLAKERKLEGIKLYYRVLENMLRAEEARTGKKDFTVLLENEIFHKCLLACSFEMIVASYRMVTLTFPAVLERLQLKAFDLCKVIETFVRHEPLLHRELKRHLFNMEEKMLECLVWERGSSLYPRLISACNETQAPPRTSLQEAFESRVGGASSRRNSTAQQELNSSAQHLQNNSSSKTHAKMAQTTPTKRGREGSPQEEDTSPPKLQKGSSGVVSPRLPARVESPQEPRNTGLTGGLLSPMRGPGQSAFQAFLSPMRPTATVNHPFIGPLPAAFGSPSKYLDRPGRAVAADFLRKVLKLGLLRLEDLCDRIDFDPQDKQSILTQVYTMVQHVVYQQTHLLYNRHLDQILLSALYGICKVNHLKQISFKEIIQHYKKQPQAKTDIFRTVIIAQSEPDLAVSQTGDIIEFYNSVFIPTVKPFVLQLGQKKAPLIQPNTVNTTRRALLSPGPMRQPSNGLQTPPPPDRSGPPSAVKVYLSPLRHSPKQSFLTPSSRIFYAGRMGESSSVYQSPSKDLKLINNRIQAHSQLPVAVTTAHMVAVAQPGSLPAQSSSDQTTSTERSSGEEASAVGADASAAVEPPGHSQVNGHSRSRPESAQAEQSSVANNAQSTTAGNVLNMIARTGARRTGASGLEDLHNAAMLLGGSDREESPPVSPSKQPRTRRSQRQVGRPQRIDL